jgi:multiple sugar transport system substrate-binding protein
MIHRLNSYSSGMLGSVSRRSLLKGAGAAMILPALSGRVFGQDAVTLRWWSPQSAPAQLEAYNAQIAAFQEANPNVTIVFEPTSDEGYPAQFAAAFAAQQLPHIVTHLPSFAVQNYYSQDLIEPFDDVIQMIGEANYYPGANDVYRTADGHYCGTGIGNTAADMLWLRKDLMEAAGVAAAPTTWDELRDAASKMQGGGIYGAPLPYGLNSMTSLIFIGFIERAGGRIFTPDLQVAIDSDETRNAVEFYKSMREFCPPGATNYSWGESLTAFVSGATATGIYAGRVLANVNEQNPGIADSVTCVTYPTISADVPSWTFNDFPSVFIPKGVDNLDAAKQFAAFLFQPPGYVQQLHGAPGHVLPVLKTVAESPEYLDNPIIEKYPAEVALMGAAAAGGFNLGYESPEHQPNLKANEIIASNVIAELVQRAVLNDENVDTVISDTATRLEQLMAG